MLADYQSLTVEDLLFFSILSLDSKKRRVSGRKTFDCVRSGVDDFLLASHVVVVVVVRQSSSNYLIST